ncbi:KR domain-containing protein, partial [Streptomyces sp. NRRL WC-3701]|uniref:KR domain-containing protein n=1 Tax=Streptomyces sp. NRRL WC-3701 TaxID=1519473 RepID=UPI000B2AF1BD
GKEGLGGELARPLVGERCVRHLLLASRSGLEAPGAEELRAELAAQGAEVTIVAGDVAGREAAAGIVDDRLAHLQEVAAGGGQPEGGVDEPIRPRGGDDDD